MPKYRSISGEKRKPLPIRCSHFCQNLEREKGIRALFLSKIKVITLKSTVWK